MVNISFVTITIIITEVETYFMSRFLSLIFISFALLSSSSHEVWGSTLKIALEREGGRSFQEESYKKILQARSLAERTLFNDQHTVQVQLDSPGNTFQASFKFLPNHEKLYTDLHEKCGKHSPCIDGLIIPTDLSLIEYLCFNFIGPSLMPNTEFKLEEQDDLKDAFSAALGESRNSPKFNPGLDDLHHGSAEAKKARFAEEQKIVSNRQALYKKMREKGYQGSFSVHLGNCGDLAISVSNKVHAVNGEREEEKGSQQGSQMNENGAVNEMSPQKDTDISTQLVFQLDNFPVHFKEFRYVFADLFISRLQEKLEQLKNKEDKSGTGSMY